MSVEDRDYIQMTRDRPRDTERERECFARLYDGEEPYQSVLETFGGTGVMCGVLRGLGLLPEQARHETWDRSEACVAHLRSTYPTAVARQVDSFVEPIVGKWDLISADFNTWTARKYCLDPRYRALTGRIFNANPEAVQLTDAAIGHLHLNAPNYARVLGIPVSTAIESYLWAVAETIWRDFSYGLIRVAHHSAASYLLFKRGQVVVRPIIEIIRVPAPAPSLFAEGVTNARL